MIDQQTFRDAMARLTAAVSVITSDGAGGLCGCTASAVCSVSDAPPILLVCINRSSRNNATLKANGRLCVNVLHANQQALAMQFSRSGTNAEERFAGAAWSLLETDTASKGAQQSPLLDGALVSLDCAITDTAEVGSHTVFYCTVDGVRFGDAGDALVYFERDFHVLPRVGPAG